MLDGEVAGGWVATCHSFSGSEVNLLDATFHVDIRRSGDAFRAVANLGVEFCDGGGGDDGGGHEIWSA